MGIGSSSVPFSYTTVRVTKSRIDKGLLAIPASLASLFPGRNGSVRLLDENGQWVEKTFTAYESTSRECRIGGMKDFYDTYDVRNGDELVLQAYGDGQYQIVPESLFQQEILDLESRFDNASTETDADLALAGLASVTRTEPLDVLISEYVRLVSFTVLARKVRRQNAPTRENVPASLQKILLGLFEGRCQVSGFTFLKRTGEPYFEVHHIDPTQGHHVKNVLVVSPNVHAQFTHAEVGQSFDESGWLRRVTFNGETYSVFQIVDELPARYAKVVHSI